MSLELQIVQAVRSILEMLKTWNASNCNNPSTKWFQPISTQYACQIESLPQQSRGKKKEKKNLWTKQPKESVRIDLVGWVQPL